MRPVYSLLAVFFVIFTACEKSDTSPINPIDFDGDVGDVAEMNHRFSVDLLGELQAEKPEDNILISPLSIQIALQMALNGADGKTRDQMLRMLHCEDCSIEKLNTEMKTLMEWLSQKSGSPELTLANSFFYDDKRIFVREQFQSNLNDYFEAGSTNYNFDNPATVDKINNWVYENTNRKIDEIVETIEPEDLAFLINALHFRADWSQGFDPELTTEEPFFTSDGREVMAPFVFDDRQFMTARTEELIMVDLPFRDSTFSLSLVMNNDPNTPISDWAQRIDFGRHIELYETLSEERALVRFPILDLSFETDLPEALERLGMVDAFSEFDANFDLLGEALIGPVIFINQLKHKAVLEVDEKGAEGAAVTSIGFGTTSLPPSYTFNRPFMLQLRHIPTNAIVFKGIVQNPMQRDSD